MKNFARITLCAAVLLMVAVIAAAALVPASAATTRTIYIAENALGTGDGSTPENAMGSVETIAPTLPKATTNWEKYTGADYHKNSALHRAATELAATGGKIVLVGDVSIDFTKTCAGAVNEDGTYTARQTYRDFFMPTHGNNEIVITNESYTGRLILTEGAMMILGGNTVFEDLDIVTHDGTATETGAKQNFTICCNGYKTKFGDGLTCKSYSGNIKGSSYTARSASTSTKAYFISIAGGHRYSATSRGADITVKSGTWNIISGGNRGNDGSEQYGDVNIKLSGGTYFGDIVGGGSYWAALSTFGNVNMELAGGKYYGGIYAIGKSPLGYENAKAYIRVKGGNFTKTNKIQKCYGASYDVDLTVDLSACTSTETQMSNLVSAVSDATVLYPASWVTSATVKSYNKIAFKDEAYDATGFTLLVTYNNGKTANVVYTPDNTKFTFTLDTSKTGAKALKWTYGSKSGTKAVTVLNVPLPTFKGAQVGVDENNLGKLRFVADMSIELSNGVTLNESGSEMPYGFMTIVNTVLTDAMNIDPSEAGNAVVLPGTKFRAENDPLGIYNSTVKRTYGAELKGLSLKDYASNVSVVAYVKFMYDGEEYVRYSPVENKSVLGVANAAYASQLENDADKAFIKTNIIDKYAAYTANKSVMYDSTSADAMRAEVVAAYKAIANYQWTPSTTFTLKVGNDSNTYNAGTIYKGIPYVNGMKATLNEFTSYITTVTGTKGSTNLYTGPIRGIYDILGTPTFDSNGAITGVSGGSYTVASVVNTYKTALENGKNIEDYVDPSMLTISGFFPGVDYSAIYNAWNVVGTNEVWPVGLAGAIPGTGSGVVAVGNYTYSGKDTKAICTSNGEAVMYAAYAACKPGDVLVNVSSSGRSLHMVTTASDGTATATTTLKRSYGVAALNTTTKSHYVIDSAVSFSSLYNSGFIPVTIPELKNGLKTPTTAILTGFDGDAVFETGIPMGRIDSNRTIISVNITIGKGSNIIYDKTNFYTTKDADMNMVDLSEFNLGNMINYFNAGETYELKVYADIAGESAPVLLKEHSYTVPENETDKFALVYNASNTSFLATPSNLSQAAIDYMWKQYNSFNWTPSHNFQYYDTDVTSSSFCPSSIYKAGVNYRGILYADMRATFDEFSKTLTSNNVLNIDTTLALKNGYYQVDWSKIMGNHCSAAMFHAYQQSSRLSAGLGSRNNPDFVSVGVEDIFASFAKGITGATATVTNAYGSYAMYEAYAQWKQGDYMYHTAGGGHTRMVNEVYVVRDAATGMIDPDKSYVLMCEQTDTLISDRIDTNGYYLYIGKAESGSTFMQFIYKNDTTTPKPTNATVYKTFDAFYKVYGLDTTWWLNNKYTFSQLGGSNNYCAIGFRPIEYITNTAEDIYVGVNKNISLADLRNKNVTVPAVIESNYPIVSVFARIKNSSGKVTEVTAVRAQTNLYSYDLSGMATKLDTALSGLDKGTYTVSVYAEVAKGEVEVLNYSYTVS